MRTAIFLTLLYTADAFVALPQAQMTLYPPIRHCSSSLLILTSSLLENTSSQWIANGHHVDIGNPYFPILGSSAIMFTIVGLLYLWETSVEKMRKAVGPELQAVVESILAEMGGLGFIGLLLQSFAPANRELLGEISLELFGEEEVLLETFEFLHTAFFQCGVAFFIAAGAMVALGLKKLFEIQTVEGLVTNSTQCIVTAEQLTAYVSVVEHPNTLPDDTIWSELVMSKEVRAGKSLLLRNTLMERYSLPSTFRIENFIQRAFADNLLELVELSPLTWVYLIPALALANSIDLSHAVINANSPNAWDASGFFVSTPIAIVPSVWTIVLSLVWGLWNAGN